MSGAQLQIMLDVELFRSRSFVSTASSWSICNAISMQVAIENKVSVGQRIARVGNSGNSSLPHLHIHAMTNAEISNSNSRPVRLFIVANDGTSIIHRRNDAMSSRPD